MHISAIKKTESKNISLVATTKFGIRLYFSINQFEQLQQTQQHKLQTQQQQTDMIDLNNMNQQQHQKFQQQPQQFHTPTTFQIVHIRIPQKI